MPELPEVEVLRGRLHDVLPGLRIDSARVLKARVTRPWTEPQLDDSLRGSVFTAVLRRGKHLVFPLRARDGAEAWMHAHLGMTGRILVEDAGLPLHRHAAIVLGMGRRRWVLVDPRQFGRVGLGTVEGLGPEPMDDSFTAHVLAAALAGSRQPVKSRLLDQSVLAGVGNIYANEALHHAAIRPARPAKSLNSAEVARLHHAIREVLGLAIRLGRSLPIDLERGADGLFYFGRGTRKTASPTPNEPALERWAVYDRAGQPCARCGGRIRRDMLGGRATFECRGCQQ